MPQLNPGAAKRSSTRVDQHTPSQLPCLGANLSGDGSISNTQAYWNLVLGLIAPLDGAPTDFQQIEFSVAVDGMEVVDEVFTGFGNQVVRERAYLLWEQVGRGIFWLRSLNQSRTNTRAEFGK